MKPQHRDLPDQLLALWFMFLFASVLGVMAFAMVVGLFTIAAWIMT